jgi:hypothetical protein
VCGAREAPHPPRSPPRSSSRPPAPGAHAAAYFSSTSPWATSSSQSSPPRPTQAHGHGDAVSVERRCESSSLHVVAAREAARLGRTRPRPSWWRRSGGVTARSTLTSASWWQRLAARSTMGLDHGSDRTTSEGGSVARINLSDSRRSENTINTYKYNTILYIQVELITT